MVLTLISKLPCVSRLLHAWLCHDVVQSFARGNTVTVFFADQYFLTDFDAIQEALAKRNPDWEIGFVTVNTGSKFMSVFFVATSLQAMWDGVSLYKNAMANRWLAFHMAMYMRSIERESKRRNNPLFTDEIYP
jgi:hypothetical protein